jgi:GPI inositol-deacylase
MQGGLIARALFTIPDFDAEIVNTVITQATPHRMPVIALDPFSVDFYSRVNTYWSVNGTRLHEKVVVLSTGGGYRDILVRDGHTILDEVNMLYHLLYYN